MNKRIKIPGRIESAETGNVVTGADAVMDDTRGKKQVVVNDEVEAALLSLGEGKQNKLTFDNTPTEDSTNPVTSGGVYAADKVLSDAIEAILLLIPSAASALNKLVDMQTMNSSIATATASFKGTYNLVSDLHLAVDATHTQIGAALDALSLDADNNDYAFVQVPNNATAPTEIKKTERYKFNGTNWAYEYDLNNSGFTSAQWNAINSGITTLLVSKLSELPTNEALTLALAGKQDNLTFDNAPMAGSNNPVKSGGIYTRNAEIVGLINALDQAKQDVLTFDNTPTENSSNPVKSGGVYTAISAVQAAIVALDAAKQNVLAFDNTPTLGSTNPVTSSGIKTELNRIDGNITTLNDLYEALTQSALVIVKPTDTWPVASPATKTIYRVVDRVNTPPQYYSDYMWNGSVMVLMATYDNAIDDEPTIDSNNLVKSGGVAEVNGYYEENPEYLGAIIDKDRRLLEATLPNGKKYLPAGADFGSVEFNEIENPEFLSVEKDSSNHVLGGYDRNGKQILSLPSNQDDLLQEQIDDLSDISKTLSEIKELQSIPPTIEVPRNNKANSLTRVNAFNQVWSLVNGLGMLKDMSNNNVTLQTDNFSHDSTLVSDGNRLYCVYVRNDESTGDSEENPDAYVAMSVINKNDLSVIQNYVIAKNGDSINGDTVRLGCGTPNAYLVDSNTVRILFNASLSDEIGYIFYRDYDIQNDTLGTVGVCTLTIDNIEYPFSDKTLHDVYGVEPYNGMLSLNSQIGYDSDNGKYYTGLCLLDRIQGSVIVDSEDLIDFNVWTVPQFTNECYAEYEGACVVWNNKLFYALRQRFGKMDMLLARFNLQTKAIEQEVLIPDSNSRPCWVVQDSYRLNLLHNLDGRGLIEVVELYSQDISGAVVIAQVPASGCAYPSVVKLGNTFYFSASANVRVFKFEKFIYLSESKLTNRLFTFLN